MPKNIPLLSYIYEVMITSELYRSSMEMDSYGALTLNIMTSFHCLKEHLHLVNVRISALVFVNMYRVMDRF